VIALFAKPALQHPQSFAHLLRALDFHLAPTKEVALIGDDVTALAATVRTDFRPHLALAAGPEGSTEPPLLRDRPPGAYVCENFTCQAPVTGPDELAALL
jgi:uncharacterized protein YyaL (SSP411 family)